MKQRYLLGIILCAPFLLTGCFDMLDGDSKVNEESKYPVAEQVCKDNGGEVTTDEEGTPICLLGGRGINLEKMEEHPEEDEKIEEVSEENEETNNEENIISDEE